MKTVDLHCDTIMLFYEGKHLRDFQDAHLSLEKLQKGEALAQRFQLSVFPAKNAPISSVQKGMPDIHMESPSAT